MVIGQGHISEQGSEARRAQRKGEECFCENKTVGTTATVVRDPGHLPAALHRLLQDVRFRCSFTLGSWVHGKSQATRVESSSSPRRGVRKCCKVKISQAGL